MRVSWGFSLMEALFAMAIMGVVLAIAFPRLVRARARVDVAAASGAFGSAHSLARQVAGQYGRPGRLHLDPNGNSFWITIDTSSLPGLQILDTIRPVVDIDRQFGGVRVHAKPKTFCFDPRGLPTARGTCDLPNATIVFRRGSVADTVTISRLGRLLRR